MLSEIFYYIGPKIHTISLDLIISESATSNSKITTHPIERCSNVSDFQILEPMKFSVTGFVSSYPTGIIDAFSKKNKPSEVWKELLMLQAKKVPFNISQHIATYNNVVIVSLTQTTDEKTINALMFTAEIQAINVNSLDRSKESFETKELYEKMKEKIVLGIRQLI